MLLAEPLTDRVIGLAIEVHRHTGPGLLESVYDVDAPVPRIGKRCSTILPIRCGATPNLPAHERNPRRSAAELQRATPGGRPSSLRGVASVEENRFCSVITVFSAFSPC